MTEFNSRTGDIVFDCGEIAKVTRETAELYTFWGDLAMFNHVFVTNEPPDPGSTTFKGHHVFVTDPAYRDLKTYVEDNGLPQTLNQNYVHEADSESYFETQLAALDDQMDGPSLS